jgi:hypothetical protein
MGTEDVYYQFPIRALNMGKKIDKVTEDEAHSRHQQIVDYCLVDYGTKNSVKAGSDHVAQVASDYIENNGLSCRGNRSEIEESLVFFAADRLGITWSKGVAVNVPHIYKNHGIINQQTGGNMQVRLRTDIFWDLNKKKLDWRDWSILSAIYAMLGGHPSKVRICYSQINALALGFDSVKSIGKQRLSQLRISDRKTQITTDKLKRRLLFSKASINYRHLWYSHKPQEELEKMLIDTEVLKQKRRIDDTAAEATARGRAEVLRQLEAYKRESAKAELARLKNKPSQVGKA